MEYKIREVRSFSVCGLETEITKWQNRNIPICRELWIQFNKYLNEYGLHQLGDWKKYAFTYKKDGKFFYYCSIPEPIKLPKQFIVKEIPRNAYLICQHVGNMETIKNTINIIYKNLLPSSKLEVKNEKFFHYERYDKRFYWDSPSSIIDIYIPIAKESICEGTRTQGGQVWR